MTDPNSFDDMVAGEPEPTVEERYRRTAPRYDAQNPTSEESVRARELYRVSADFAGNDHGNAQRLAYYVGTNDLRYCKDTDQWFNWDGRRWNPATDADMMSVAREVASVFMINEPWLKTTDDGRRAHWNHVVQSMNKGRLRSMVDVATGDESLWKSSTEFNQDPYVWNFLNGTLDTRTGELRPHRRGDYITKLIRHRYVAGAKCPKWEALVRRVFQDADRGCNGATYDFVKRALGYSTLGQNFEQVAFFLEGPANCGKSKMPEILAELLADYVHKSKPELIAKRRQGHHDSEIFSLLGVHLSYVSETSTVFALDETAFKALTGDRKITARKLFESNEKNPPVTFTIWVITNDLPNIDQWDDAVARRVIVLRAGPAIPMSERNPTLDDEIIAEEAEGVLAWLAEGAIAYHRAYEASRSNPEVETTGLHRPASVITATTAYAQSQDHIQQFIDDVLVLDANAKMPCKDVMDAAKRWKSAGEGVTLRRNTLYRRIGELEGVKRDDRYFYGIKLGGVDAFLASM